MPNYKFYLHDGGCGLEDSRGVSLRNPQQALAYAEDVVNELMQGREAKTRSWSLAVYDGEDEKLFEIPFASMDSTLGLLRPDLRSAVEHACERKRSLAEAVYAVTQTVRETRALIAKSRGRPYVATEQGVKIIRDE